MSWSVIPPNGWHFPIAGGEPLKGNDHDHLVQVVTAYRIDNGLPLGEPEQDVDQYLCAQFPHLCHGGQGTSSLVSDDDDAPQKAYGIPVTKRISERIAQWAANRYSRLGAIKFVDQEEAERRSGICIACIENKPNWKRETTDSCPGCGPRVEQLGATLYKLRQGKAVVRESKLGACNAAGHDCQTAVWLSEEALRHRKYHKLPPNCWMNDLKSVSVDSTT